MERVMFVSDLMKTEVIAVAPENTLADAARMMLAQRASGLPVVEGGRLVGIVTEGDLLRRVEIGTEGKKHSWLTAFFLPNSLASEYVHTHGRFVRDVMTPSPIAVTPDTGLTEVAEIMSHKHIKLLPVVENDRVVGVISRTDMLRVLARRLIDTSGPLTEAQIRDNIVSTLAQEPWVPKSGIRVGVTGSVVHLEGTVFSSDEQHAVRVIAETSPGVTEVRDDLVFIDPGSGVAFPAA
jgi:CBS domain-containing protein